MGKKSKTKSKHPQLDINQIHQLIAEHNFEQARQLFSTLKNDDQKEQVRSEILNNLLEMNLSDAHALKVLDVLSLPQNNMSTVKLISTYRAGQQLLPVMLVEAMKNKKFKTVENIFKPEDSRPEMVLWLQQFALKNIPVDFKPKEVMNLLDSAKIDLASFSFQDTIYANQRPLMETTLTATSILTNFLYNAWQQSSKNAKALLNCFVQQGLDINALQNCNNALLYSIQTYREEADFLEFIQFLLSSGKVNVNAIVTVETDPMSARFHPEPLTAFSAAIGTLNKDLCAVLLEAGANPHLAMKHTGTSSVTFICSSFGLEKLSSQNATIYLRQIDKLINQFFFQKLLKTIENEQAQQHEQEEHTIKDQAQNDSSSLAPISTEASRSGPADQEQADAEERDLPTPTAQEQDNQGEILQQYIEHLNSASQNENLSTEIRDERKFDALVLRYIQTENEEILEEIHEFLSAREAGNDKSYINVLLELGASVDLADEVLARQPQLLHKFCSAKKHAATAEEPMDVMVTTQQLAPGIYQVPGKAIFLKLSDDVKASLDTGECKSFCHKVLTQLEDPKFIAAKSLGLSGIKNYGENIFKLKIAKVDANLVSTKSYIDKSGNLLIEFDQILRHKEIDRLTTDGERVELDDIGHMIFAPMVMETGDEHEHHSNLSSHTMLEEDMPLTGDSDGNDE